MTKTTRGGTPVPPGSTAQELVDLVNHEDPPLPLMTPQLADQPPQEQDASTYGTTGTPLEERPPEPVRPWETPHPMKPPIPLVPPSGHSVAVEEEPKAAPDKFAPNPADDPKNFAKGEPPIPAPNMMAKAAKEARRGR